MSEMVPEDWRVESVSECCEILDSQRIPLNSEERAKRPGDYPYYGANGIQGFVDDYIFDGDAILVAEDGGNFDQYADRPIAQWVTGRFWVNNHAHIIRATGNNFNKWVFYSLVHKNILKYINGGTRAKLNQSDLKEINIPLPPLQEQKKIASILTSVDEVIENTQKQIDKLKDLKKATMNELLTKGIGHTEFKDSVLGTIPKSWGVSIVKNYIVEMTSGWSPDCLPEPVVGSQWGILKTTSVTWNGFDINENKALPAHLDGRTQISLRAGDVLVTRAGPIDRVGVVAFCNETYPKIMLSDKIIRIRCKSDELTGEFLSIWLGSSVAQQNMRSKISGMAEAQSNISQDILKSIPMPLPSLAEQQKIVEILQSLDVRIIMQKNKLAQTQSLKKSLMQDLLTGKVRVQVN